MKRNRRFQMCVLAAGLLIAATGCSSANDPLTMTSPMQEAMLSASDQPLVFCADSCVFEGFGVNRGLGCAAGVHGSTTAVTADGRIRGSAQWRLRDGSVIRPGESFLYDGCCFNPNVKLLGVHYETDFQWQNVSCPAS